MAVQYVSLGKAAHQGVDLRGKQVGPVYDVAVGSQLVDEQLSVRPYEYFLVFYSQKDLPRLNDQGPGLWQVEIWCRRDLNLGERSRERFFCDCKCQILEEVVWVCIVSGNLGIRLKKSIDHSHKISL
jgi:hypothetical protein